MQRREIVEGKKKHYSCVCGGLKQAHPPPQDVPQCYTGYSELKAVLTSGSCETSASPFHYLEELEPGALPFDLYSRAGQTCLLIILQWRFGAPKKHYSIPGSGSLTFLHPTFCLGTSHVCGVSDPPLCVGSHTYVCTKFGFFLLLLCLMSISLSEQPKEH